MLLERLVALPETSEEQGQEVLQRPLDICLEHSTVSTEASGCPLVRPEPGVAALRDYADWISELSDERERADRKNRPRSPTSSALSLGKKPDFCHKGSLFMSRIYATWWRWVCLCANRGALRVLSGAGLLVRSVDPVRGPLGPAAARRAPWPLRAADGEEAGFLLLALSAHRPAGGGGSGAGGQRPPRGGRLQLPDGKPHQRGVSAGAEGG